MEGLNVDQAILFLVKRKLEQEFVERKKRRTSYIDGLPNELLFKILQHIPVSLLIHAKTYLVCKKFASLILSESMLGKWLFAPYGLPPTDAPCWSVEPSTRSVSMQIAAKHHSMRERYLFFKERYFNQSRFSDIYKSNYHKCNAIQCVMIDPELGMRDTFLDQAKSAKFNTKHATPIYARLVNRSTSKAEVKVIFCIKKTIPCGKRKLHDNDLFESIMSMLYNKHKQGRLSIPTEGAVPNVAGYWIPYSEENTDHFCYMTAENMWEKREQWKLPVTRFLIAITFRFSDFNGWTQTCSFCEAMSLATNKTRLATPFDIKELCMDLQRIEKI
jgi:hypothetical protein